MVIFLLILEIVLIVLFLEWKNNLIIPVRERRFDLMVEIMIKTWLIDGLHRSVNADLDRIDIIDH